MRVLGWQIGRVRNVRYADIRESELRCARCRKWKADDEFYRDKTRPPRRGRAQLCKPCTRLRKQSDRKKRVAPTCEACGKPRPYADSRHKTGLCRSCFVESGLAAESARRAAAKHTEAAAIRDLERTTYTEKRMIRIDEVARRLDCSPSTVRRLIANGQLPATQFAGPNTSLRIDEAALEEWLTRERA